jgi:biopolymer transport protein ExbD
MNTKSHLLSVIIIAAGATLAKADNNLEKRITDLEARVTQLEQGYIAQPSLKAKSEMKKDIVIHVARNGTLLLALQKCDLADLSAKLKKMGSSQRKTRVIILADKKADTQYISDVCNASKAATVDPDQVSLGWESTK